MIPQAFTTRDMAEAYKWVQTLPPHVREEMKSMEQVVSLYLRAKRLGGGPMNVQTPSAEEIKATGPAEALQSVSKNSSQEFQKTLKNLKVELEQFDFAGQQAALNTNPSTNSAGPAGTNSSPVQGSLPLQGHGPAESGAGQHEPGAHHHGNPLAAVRMDPRSRQMINEIREGLNLSSDLEVIRMSLVLAHKSLVSLIK